MLTELPIYAERIERFYAASNTIDDLNSLCRSIAEGGEDLTLRTQDARRISAMRQRGEDTGQVMIVGDRMLTELEQHERGNAA
jgi:hypothetical protein